MKLLNGPSRETIGSKNSMELLSIIPMPPFEFSLIFLVITPLCAAIKLKTNPVKTPQIQIPALVIDCLIAGSPKSLVPNLEDLFRSHKSKLSCRAAYQRETPRNQNIYTTPTFICFNFHHQIDLFDNPHPRFISIFPFPFLLSSCSVSTSNPFKKSFFATYRNNPSANHPIMNLF